MATEATPVTVVGTLPAGRLVEVTGEVPPRRAIAVGVTSSPNPDMVAVLEETSTEAFRTASRVITLTAPNKAAMVNPRAARTETLKAAMDDRTTTLMATNKAATVNPIVARTETNKAVTVNPTVARTETLKVTMDDRTTPTEAIEAALADPTTNRTKAPGAATDNQTTPMGATEVAMVNLTTARTERAATDDRMTTRAAANKVVTVDPTTNRMKTPRAATDDRTTPTGVTAAIVDQKIPTQAPPPVPMDRMISLVPTAVVDMVGLVEAIVLNGTMTIARVTPVVIVRDINPRISRRRTLTPLATPTPPVIPILLEEAMGEVVRRKARITPLVIAAAEGIITKSITMTITRPMALRN